MCRKYRKSSRNNNDRLISLVGVQPKLIKHFSMYTMQYFFNNCVFFVLDNKHNIGDEKQLKTIEKGWQKLSKK